MMTSSYDPGASFVAERRSVKEPGFTKVNLDSFMFA
jgi:hypothetical protein